MNLAFAHVRVLRAAMLSAAVFVSTADQSFATEVVADVAKQSTDLSVEQRKSLEPVLRSLLQARVDKQERVPGQEAIIVVGDVSFNDSGDELLVELGKGYVPTYYGGDFEDRINDLALGIYVYMDEIGTLGGVDFTFEGRDIFDYFPYERGLKEQAEMSRRDAKPATLRKPSRRGRCYTSSYKRYRGHERKGYSYLLYKRQGRR